MKAEISLDSILYRNIPYQVEPGSIGEEQKVMNKISDTELLAQFLLAHRE